MSGDEAPLLVVESEAEVRWAWERGRRASTRAELKARLRARLMCDVVLASPVAVRLALSDVLTRLAKTEGWLTVLRERGGTVWLDLVAAADATLTEAHRMTWHDALMESAGVTHADDPRTRTIAAAARELSRVLSSAGLLHPAAEDERVARALSLATPGDVVSALGVRSLLASAIASWYPSELALWRALDARLSLASGSAVIELVTFERPLDAARAPDPTGRLVDAVAEALDTAPTTRPIAPVLGDLGGTLGEESLAKIEIRRSDGARAEARAVVDAVREALSAGAPPEEIAIVVPEDAPVRRHLSRLLDDVGLAAHDTATPTEDDGLVAFALEALAVAERGAQRLDVATLLRSTYIDPSRLLGLPLGQAAAPRAMLARALEETRGVAASHPTESLAATVLSWEGGDPEGRARLSALARRVGETLERAASGTRRLEHVANARRFIDALGLHARAGSGAATLLAGDSAAMGLVRAELGAFVRDARGRERLDEVLSGYEAAASRLSLVAPVDFETFRLELGRALREDGAAPGRARSSEAPSTGAVRICGLAALPSRPLALLVFADAHGGALDSVPRATPLLSGVVRARLIEAIEPALRPSVFVVHDADAIRLASAAHDARRIVLTYTTRDDEGALRPPHPLVPWLERQGVRQTTWRDRVVADRPLTDHDERLALLRRSTRGGGPPTIAAWAVERAAIEARRERWFGATSAPAESAVDAPRASDAVQAILVEETGGAARAMSVTALDRFGACRFQGFAAQVLGARSRLALSEIVGLREEGILLHGALEASFQATRDLWRARPRDAGSIRARSRRATASFLRPERASSRLLRASLDEIADRVASVVEWSLFDESWDFAHAEASFGRRSGGWEATELADVGSGGIPPRNGGTSIRLTGSMDRVDTSADGKSLRIVDYKRSEDSACRNTEDLGEAGFQLAVYGRAASRALGKPVTSGMYLPTRRLAPDYRTRGTDVAWPRAHAMDGGLPRFERRALDLVRAVRGGDVDPRPKSADVCRWCDHDGACRKPRFVIESALADDPDGPRAGSA